MAKKLTTEEFIQRSKDKFGDKFDYSKTIYVNKRTPVTIICKEHGEFRQLPIDGHLQTITGCPICGHNQSNIKRRMSNDEYINVLKNTYGTLYDYSKVIYQGQKKKITLICPKHGEFSLRADGYLNKVGCPYCLRSKNEEIIQSYLDSKKIRYISQYRIKNPFEGRSYIDIDFYLPDYNIFIEYNGKQHYVPIEYFGGKLRLQYQQIRDNNLRQYCVKNNINLIEIRYDQNTIEVLNEFLLNKIEKYE